MPWQECSVMDERLQFVGRRLAGEPMTELCREFGISRKTGYKIFDRYQECGVQGSGLNHFRWQSVCIRGYAPYC
jgi:Homeodomain-like domain